METTLQAPVLYTTIHKLPLSRFVDALCDGDFKALVIAGEPTDEQIYKAWGDILDEYLDASAGSKQIHYIRICAEVKRLEVKYNMAISLINTMRECFVQRFADRLNTLLQCKFQYNIRNLEEYDALLDKAFNRTKGIRILLELKQSEKESMDADFKGQATQPKREDFSKTLIALSDHAGRELFEDQITVFTFCERVKRYNKFIEAQRTKQ